MSTINHSEISTDTHKARIHPAKHPVLRFLLFLIISCCVISFLRLSNPSIPDPDSFYHFRHAALYLQKGLFMHEFPWLPYSVIGHFASDIGYGFHVLLIPFTLMRDPILGMKLASIFEAVLVMVMFYFVMRRHGLACDFAWPFMLLLLGPPLPFLVFMTRPQTLTMGLSALLLSFMASGGLWGVLITSFAIAFIHLNIFLVIPVIVFVSVIIRYVTEKTWGWKLVLASLIGLCLGWLLRPNPIGVAKLEYVQVLTHELVRRAKVPLLFGREWRPLSYHDALPMFTFFLAIWLLMIALFLIVIVRKRAQLEPRNYSLLWISFALSVMFFIIMMLSTRRTTALWASVAVLFVAAVFSHLMNSRGAAEKQLLRPGARSWLALSVVALFALMIWDTVNDHLIKRTWYGIEPHRLQAASTWLRENSRPEEIVFNTNWDLFCELFFWNTKNCYVSGMDPIFLYAYDPKLYWKIHHLETGEAIRYTSGAVDYQEGKKEETFAVLFRDFNASFMIVSKNRNSALHAYLESDKRFTRRFEDNLIAVYQVASEQQSNHR